ncbi:ribose-phosphate pyrophosphokinase 2-like [Scaptodrosophila lebanonensis]|uniref:ribose-phosphate diphosphokinase n=1 Tax=Drosophila lebanonensis TaxID=7225 RepID=A0A6J2UAK5_DROLE|nr:ribose-phosphate pyrophosphokinase 2-like [Scaptodrosophila lebanonensis]
MHRLVILSGSSHPEFTQLIAEHLNIAETQVLRGKFANGEIRFELEESIRGADVFIVQSHCGAVNDMLMELLIMAQTCRYASAHRITAVLPFFPYARQDKMQSFHQPITAKLVANMLVLAGVDHVLTLHLHADQLQGFFDIPCDNLSAEIAIIPWIQRYLPNWQEMVIVAPDNGAVKIASSIAAQLDLRMALLHKDRVKPGEVRDMVLVGDVTGKPALLVDDMADTSRTLLFATQRLIEAGASKVYAVVTHGVFSGNAIQLLTESPIELIMCTNSLPQAACDCDNKKFHVIDISRVFKQCILHMHKNKSVHQLFASRSMALTDDDHLQLEDAEQVLEEDLVVKQQLEKQKSETLINESKVGFRLSKR